MLAWGVSGMGKPRAVRPWAFAVRYVPAPLASASSASFDIRSPYSFKPDRVVRPLRREAGLLGHQQIDQHADQAV